MKELRFNSRERAVIRCIDETSGTLGEEILEQAHMEDIDLLDVLQGLINTGVLEAYAPNEDLPLMSDVPLAALRTTRFEMNPAFAQEVRQAMRRV